MKKRIISVAALALSLNVYAANDAAWMRYCSISPDGTQIAFTYQGDIYTVPTSGGRATNALPSSATSSSRAYSLEPKVPLPF